MESSPASHMRLPVRHLLELCSSVDALSKELWALRRRPELGKEAVVQVLNNALRDFNQMLHIIDNDVQPWLEAQFQFPIPGRWEETLEYLAQGRLTVNSLVRCSTLTRDKMGNPAETKVACQTLDRMQWTVSRPLKQLGSNLYNCDGEPEEVQDVGRALHAIGEMVVCTSSNIAWHARREDPFDTIVEEPELEEQAEGSQQTKEPTDQ